MPEKFKNKYTIKSARLAGYDYSQNGLYFVTICTRDREHFFGEIVDGKMVLSDIGKIVQEEILKTPAMRKNILLDEWVIMPNHIHIVMEICNIETGCRDALQCVSTDIQYKNKFGPQINNLSSIIRGFKGIVTNRTRSMQLYFAWQPRFYDHIIRNDESLNKIREYIQMNPGMWERDRNNVENIFI